MAKPQHVKGVCVFALCSGLGRFVATMMWLYRNFYFHSGPHFYARARTHTQTHTHKHTHTHTHTLIRTSAWQRERERERERERVSSFVLWALSTTKDYIRAERKLHSISGSKLFIPQVMFFFFLAYLHSAGIQHGNLHPARWPILFCEPTQEPVLAAANSRKTWERFWKKCRWMDQKRRN